MRYFNELEVHAPNNRKFTIQRLKGEEVADRAKDIAGILFRGYTNQFEHQLRVLPSGTIKTHLADPTDNTSVSRVAGRVRNAMRGGSSYWLAFEAANEDQPVGLAKTTPSRSWVRRHLVPDPTRDGKRPNAFLNDVIVDPGDLGAPLDSNGNMQGKRLGTVLTVAALWGDYRQDRTVVSDLFAVSDVVNKKFFYAMGFHPVDRETEALQIGPHQLAYQRVEATVGDIMGNAFTRYPWMLSARHDGQPTQR